MSLFLHVLGQSFEREAEPGLVNLLGYFVDKSFLEENYKEVDEEHILLFSEALMLIRLLHIENS